MPKKKSPSRPPSRQPKSKSTSRRRSPSKPPKRSMSKRTSSSRSEDPQASTRSKELSPELPPPSSPSLETSSSNNCPPWLHSKPTACEKWHELCGLLQARNQLDLCDYDLLSLYCEAWQQIVDADAMLQMEGEVLYGEKGGAYMHPAALKRNIAMDRVTRIAKELGIGFRARKGTSSPSGHEESELDSF